MPRREFLPFALDGPNVFGGRVANSRPERRYLVGTSEIYQTRRLVFRRSFGPFCRRPETLRRAHLGPSKSIFAELPDDPPSLDHVRFPVEIRVETDGQQRMDVDHIAFRPMTMVELEIVVYNELDRMNPTASSIEHFTIRWDKGKPRILRTFDNFSLRNRWNLFTDDWETGPGRLTYLSSSVHCKSTRFCSFQQSQASALSCLWMGGQLELTTMTNSKVRLFVLSGEIKWDVPFSGELILMIPNVRTTEPVVLLIGVDAHLGRRTSAG